ncbi:MAG: carboxypeptidase-like regulatory domain-containing protein, partial [Planctomycetota bacterium]
MSRHSASSAIACFVLLGLLLCSHSGCWQALNPARPKLVPVSGQVLLDGEPVGGAKVVFLPQQLFDGGNRVQPVASALTDEQGNFCLRTTGQPGTPAGAYWVLLSKLEVPAGEGAPKEDAPALN